MAMEILFCDSFDHYASADTPQKYDSGTHNIGSDGRHGSNQATNVSSSKKNFGLSYQDWHVMFAAKTNSVGSTLFALNDGLTAQVDLRLDSANRPVCTRNGTVVAQGTVTVGIGEWHHYEWLVHIADAPFGWTALRLDGIEVFHVTDIDTKNTANASANVAALSISNADDLVVRAGSGMAYPSDCLGDLGVYALFPNGAGNYAGWSRGGSSPAATNYEGVDETAPNEETDYNYSTTAGQKDSFTFSDPELTGSVKALQMLIDLRKDDAGSRQVRPFLRIGGVDYFGDTIGVPDTYKYVRYIWELNPATNQPWTVSEINAVEAGYELVA